mmetsp:Transcript_4405/g.16298  ORF Transcript_4405/g.16298 Transcript_4405/m.16298 type:complete len:224 (-) Transcript_4405:8961-9632(-)
MNIACTHWHKPFAAPDTAPTFSGVYSGSLMYFLILPSKASSSLSLSKFIKPFRNCESPSAFFAASQVGDFLSTVITPFKQSSTSAGGLLYAFSSDMSFLVNTFRAFCAASSAGIAKSKPAWHSAAIWLASSASRPILAASALTCFSWSSATRLSAMMVTRSDSHSTFAAATTTCFSSAIIVISPTCTEVSSSFKTPPRSLFAMPPICVRFSVRRRRYPLTNSR